MEITFQIVCVEWEDTKPYSGWIPYRKKPFKPEAVLTTGFLVEETDDYVAISSTCGDKDCLNLLSISKHSIIKMHFLQSPFEDDDKEDKDVLGKVFNGRAESCLVDEDSIHIKLKSGKKLDLKSFKEIYVVSGNSYICFDNASDIRSGGKFLTNTEGRKQNEN